MRAAPIWKPDPWVLTSASGAVRLAPLRLMTLREQKSVPDTGVLLDLTNDGHFDGSNTTGPSEPPVSPLATSSEVVLLLPWSLLPTIAELEAHARITSSDYQPHFAPEDWLATWHHFVATEEWTSSCTLSAVAQGARSLQFLPSDRGRRYVIGTMRHGQGGQRASASVRRAIARRSPLDRKGLSVLD